MTTEYKKPLPYINNETKGLLDGAKSHQLLLRKCGACGQFHFYPRDFCPSCFSFAVEWVKASGRGTVYSVTVCHLPQRVLKMSSPTILHSWNSKKAPMMTNIVGCPNEDIKIGMAVEVTFDDVTPEVTLPKFRPVNKHSRF